MITSLNLDLSLQNLNKLKIIVIGNKLRFLKKSRSKIEVPQSNYCYMHNMDCVLKFCSQMNNEY